MTPTLINVGEKYWCIDDLVQFEVFKRGDHFYMVHFQGTCSKIRWIPKDQTKFFENYTITYAAAVIIHRKQLIANLDLDIRAFDKAHYDILREES